MVSIGVFVVLFGLVVAHIVPELVLGFCSACSVGGFVLLRVIV